MSDLGDLWGAMDGVQDDLLDFGTTTLATFGTVYLANRAVDIGMEKFGASLPPMVSDYVIPAALIVGGAVGGGYVATRYSRNIGTGVGVGLMLAGVNRLAKRLAPTVALGAFEDVTGNEVMINGTDPFGEFMGQLPVTAESVNGISVGVETVNGLSAWGQSSNVGSFIS